MYYLGIDPGMRKLGFALIDQNLKIYDAGIILNEDQNNNRLQNFQRIYENFKYLQSLIIKHPIKCMGIEKLYFTKYNQANAEFIYTIRGALLMLCLERKITFWEITPTELKKKISGQGKAGKLQIKQFIQKIFQLQDIPQYADVADALSIAYLSTFQKTIN